MTDLIQRLRSQEAVDARPHEIEQLTDEAADQLEANSALIALLRASLHKAEDEVEGLRRDAERYRYLRSIDRRSCLEAEGPAAGCWIDCEGEDGALYLLTEDDADSFIDAALSNKKEGS